MLRSIAFLLAVLASPGALADLYEICWELPTADVNGNPVEGLGVRVYTGDDEIADVGWVNCTQVDLLPAEHEISVAAYNAQGEAARSPTTRQLVEPPLPPPPGVPTAMGAPTLSFLMVGGGNVGSPTLPAAASSNAERILAILNGREAPFAYNTPADPVTTGDPVVVTTAAEFDAAAQIPGTQIIINTSFSGNVSVVADDIDVVMSNSATISGRLVLGSGIYINRLRWTGGNIGSIQGIRFRDVLFDDLYAVASAATAPDPTRPEHGFNGGWDGSANPAWFRLAIINSTLELAGDPNAPVGAWPWAFHSGTAYRNEDLIWANLKLISNLQNNRVSSQDRFIVVDSVMNPDGASSNGMRIHREGTNVWVRDSWGQGFMKYDAVNADDAGPSVVNGTFENFDRYYAGAWAFTSGFANTGVVRNSTHYGAGSFDVSPFTDGGGNAAASWDGVTVPDYSAIGAIR